MKDFLRRWWEFAAYNWLMVLVLGTFIGLVIGSGGVRWYLAASFGLLGALTGTLLVFGQNEVEADAKRQYRERNHIITCPTCKGKGTITDPEA